MNAPAGAVKIAEAVGTNREAIVALARDFSIETTPKQAEKVADFAALLPAGSRVFVTFVPGETVDAVVTLIARLAQAGLRPVPHVPARNLRSEATFEHLVRGSFAAGAREALVIAGGATRPVGPYASSLELLRTGLFESLGFTRLFVAGHPEGSPDIPEPEVARALEFKNLWSARSGIPLEIVTQFGFDASRVLDWEQRIRRAGNRLPIRIGVAGPASVTSLLRYAKLCGVSASLSFLQRRGASMLQLVGQVAPDGMIAQLAQARRRGEASAIRGLHYYPFGGFARTAHWASAVANGEFRLFSDGSAFAVTT